MSDLFACPRAGCHRVVDRLHYVRVSEGLTDRDPLYCCDRCLEELRVIESRDPCRVNVLVVAERELH